MTCVLVTGGSGFIGQQLVAALLARQRQTRILDLKAPGPELKDAEFLQGSVLNPDVVQQAFDDVDEVYHLAGLPGMWAQGKQEFHDVNYRGTEIVIATARKRGVSRLLHCSTESILFRSPRLEVDSEKCALASASEMPGLYTRSKLLAERLVLQAAASGFPAVIGSPTMPIGPQDYKLTPVVAMIRHFMRRRIQFYFDFVLNLVDVRDVGSGLILAMERGQVGHRYLLGGESIYLKDLLQDIAAISGRLSFPIPIPGLVAEAAAAAIESISNHITHRPPAGTAEGVRIALRSTALSIDKARRDLGYTPRPIGPALRDTITYLVNAHAD